jgi:hypothetical protein
MNKQTHKLIRGPHLLYTGGNGHKTYGITVKSIIPPNPVMTGRANHEYNLNDYTLGIHEAEEFLYLGETLESIKAIQAEIKKLEEEQT